VVANFSASRPPATFISSYKKISGSFGCMEGGCDGTEIRDVQGWWPISLLLGPLQPSSPNIKNLGSFGCMERGCDGTEIRDVQGWWPISLLLGPLQPSSPPTIFQDVSDEWKGDVMALKSGTSRGDGQFLCFSAPWNLHLLLQYFRTFRMHGRGM